MTANTIVLEVNSPTFETIILSDDAEVLPGITAGDLLAEELDIDVPYGTLVLVQSSHASASMSEAVGYMICQLAVALAAYGTSGSACADQELLDFAEIFTALADAELAGAGGLSVELFRKGLSQGLREHWSSQQGVPSSDDGVLRAKKCRARRTGRGHQIRFLDAADFAAGQRHNRIFLGRGPC